MAVVEEEPVQDAGVVGPEGCLHQSLWDQTTEGSYEEWGKGEETNGSLSIISEQRYIIILSEYVCGIAIHFGDHTFCYREVLACLPDFSASSLRRVRQRIALLWWAATTEWNISTCNSVLLARPIWGREMAERTIQYTSQHHTHKEEITEKVQPVIWVPPSLSMSKDPKTHVDHVPASQTFILCATLGHSPTLWAENKKRGWLTPQTKLLCSALSRELILRLETSTFLQSGASTSSSPEVVESVQSVLLEAMANSPFCRHKLPRPWPLCGLAWCCESG